MVKGTVNGCITDLDGNFKLTNVPSKGILVVSFVGYQTQAVSYTHLFVMNQNRIICMGNTELYFRLIRKRFPVHRIDPVSYTHLTLKNTEIKVFKLNDGKYYYVTEGLKAGDKVVKEGVQNLRDGACLLYTSRKQRSQSYSYPNPALSVFQGSVRKHGLHR